MGILIFGIVFFLITCLCAILCYVEKKKNCYADTTLGIYATIVIGFISFLFFIGFGIYYLKKDISYQEQLNERYKLSRMIQEDYNAKNLENAISFNNQQKIIVAENKTFFLKWNNSFTFVDTIEIPSKNFIPTEKIIIQTP